ncbi:MAG: hypothetical protein GXO36_03910, partial [Chloroflexi bacterium]|nr:hypothetical protein [Chloroflexota bacterium]
SLDEVLARWTDTLTQAGWVVLQEPDARGDGMGFAPRPSHPSRRFCHDEAQQTLDLVLFPDPERGTWSALTLFALDFEESGASCASLKPPVDAESEPFAELPNLQLPQEARWRRGTGWLPWATKAGLLSPGTAWAAGVVVEYPRDATALHAALAPQVEAQGWTKTAEALSPALAWSRWRATRDGLLLIWRRGPSEYLALLLVW